MGVEDYRTPEEIAEYEAEHARVMAAIEEAKANLAFSTHAIATAEPPAVVEAWIEQTYDGLERLSKRELARAVLTLLAQDASALAGVLRAPVGDDDVEEVTGLWTEQGYGA